MVLCRVVRFRLVALLALLAFLGTAEAQYFGRNKVLWERFDFVVLETEHFLVHYYPADAPHGEYAARLAERWYARLSRFFDHEFEEKKPLIIYANHADFQQTVVTPSLIGEGTGGFTESLRNRVVLPLTGIHADNDHVIGHELVHVFQFDLMNRLNGRSAQSGQRSLPLWAIEGLAEYLSQGRFDPATALYLRDAVAFDRLPDPTAFVQRQPSPYQYGQAVWAYVAGRWGDEAVRDTFVSALSLGLEAAFGRVLGLEPEAFFAEFHAELRDAYAPVLDARRPLAQAARPLLTAETTLGSVNLAPALSPDGRRIAFLSSRELDLELYLADAESGEILTKLVAAEADPHFQNLSFVDASVGWSPDGRRIAFSVFARGERRLAIYDVERERFERRLDLEGIGGARHPVWTPDGRGIVFSAIVAGASDLFRVDVESGEVTRLTADPYTAIHPAVSPDGRRIVFATDRGAGTDLERLAFGPLRLAVLDVATGEIETLPISAEGPQIDPEFSADGESVYFVGTPDGVPDVFRYSFASGTVERLTALQIGVSGITAVSPALTAVDGRIAFSALHDGRWVIYALDPASGGIAEPEPGVPSGVLPPFAAAEAPSLVESYLADPDRGLPPAGRVYPTVGYDSRLSVAAIGPVSIGLGSWNGGTDLAGAFGVYFNDPLNRHQLVTTVHGGSTQGVLDFEDTFGGDVTYLNLKRRFQWGASLARVPYLASATFFSRGTVDIDGVPVPADVVERLIEAQQVTELSALGRYPLSLNNRFEALAGITRIDFERELERSVFPLGRRPYREEIGLPSPATLDLRQAGVAFVRDTARFGLVSPVRGARLRLETRWITGDLDYRTALVDFRRYFFRRPLTFALRALHIGRRGEGAEDPRLPPLDIGNNSLVRGYELGSFDLDECTPVPDSNRCPEFDRLIGSRIAVLNMELRLALLGTEDFGLFSVPAAPTELVFFIDAGAAWSSGRSVDLTFDRHSLERVPVVSAGIGARTLALGALPIEVFYAHPYQRPRKDSVFGFRIAVAW